MVNISAALNSGKVQAYHQMDYASETQKSYYTGDSKAVGQWHGRLSEEMGLSGDVDSDHFRRLAEGQDPHTAEPLVKHRHATENSAAHRAGWDATFSAPKSVSITALVGGDQRIVDAHRQAVQKGLDYLERSVEARMGGNTPPERTGKWVAATFEHDTSRPVDGYSAPQLHTHAVFFNITKTEDGKAHALDPRAIFQAQKTATAIYQAELGYRLRELGYELEEGKGGAREIKGYSEDYLRANSSRSEQIAELAKRLQEEHGLNAAEARQRAAHSTREGKGHTPPEQTRAQQQELARRFGNQHERVIAQAHSHEHQNRQAMTQEQARKSAAHAVGFATEKTFEREAVVSEHELLREALRRGQDSATPTHIHEALRDRQARGQLIPMQGKGREAAYTTPEMVAMERQNISLMKAGQNQHAPFVPDTPALDGRINTHFREFEASASQESDSSRRQQLEAAIANQKQAIREVLTNTDKVQAFQGAAGTGKTTSLTVVRKELESQGYKVRGFAPTSRAAQQLAECGAECSTLQMHLTKNPKPAQERTVYFVDETSLASAKQVNELLRRLGDNERLVLIGDVRQHEAVEAGRAFAQLQEHGIRTTRLDEIIRQKDQSLREAVNHLAQSRVGEAVDLLKAQGRVSEIADETTRLKAISNDYLANPKGTLVVSPDNRSRAAINGIIHQELQRTGAVQKHDLEASVLVNRQDITGADRKWARSYEVGNVLRYNTSSTAFQNGEEVLVKAVDSQANLITVAKQDGTAVTYNPERCHGVTVYRQETRNFAIGERVQFTAPFKARKIANRELGTIQAINDKTVTLAMDSGKTVTFERQQHRNLDYGYAVTSHSSQGLSTDRVLINIDTNRTNPHLINERLAYVAVSRAKYDARIYTNDATALAPALSRDVSKSSAITIAPAQHNGRANGQQHGTVQMHGQPPAPTGHNRGQGTNEQLPGQQTATPAETPTPALSHDSPQQAPPTPKPPLPTHTRLRRQEQRIEQSEEHGFGF